LEPEIAFEWDASNLAHLRLHAVSPQEIDEVFWNEALDLEYDIEAGEERYKSLGTTSRGRILIVVWTVRDARIRPITAYTASKKYRTLFLKSRGMQ
jgi:uncharacterized DUF497 family protein